VSNKTKQEKYFANLEKSGFLYSNLVCFTESAWDAFYYRGWQRFWRGEKKVFETPIDLDQTSLSDFVNELERAENEVRSEELRELVDALQKKVSQ